MIAVFAMLCLIAIAPRFASAADRTFAYSIDPDPVVPDHFVDPAARACAAQPQSDLPAWDVPGWVNYMRLWSTLAADPDNQSIRQFLSLPIGDEAKLSLAAIKASRGRSAPSWIGWKPGSYAQVDTPHFQIFSRSDRERTTEVAEDLERCYWVWTQLFFPLWDSNAQVALHLGDDTNKPIESLLQEARGRLSSRKKMRVVLLRDADDYGRTLARLTGGSVKSLSQSTGFYSSERRTSFFYPTDKSDGIASRRHELVHQLFREATRNSLSGDIAGESADFWLIEGIAGYFESLHFSKGYATVGGWDSPRIQFARYRIFANQQIVPLDELRPDGRDAVQQRGDLAQFYAFAIGYTHWMMDGENDSARRWLYARLASLYRIRTEVPLADGITVDSPGFDSGSPERGLVGLLRVDDSHLVSNPVDRNLEELCLRGTMVGPKGLQSIGQSTQLRWLDLSGLPIESDQLLSFVPEPSKLEQLSLEGCKIDNQVAGWIAKATSLEELDVTNTACGDPLVQALNKLKSLQTLWLTNTVVTDAVLVDLAGLPRIETIDVRGTSVSASGLAKLRRKHPEWNLNPN